jgi:lipopolysaccharide export system permease protein
MLKKTDRLVLTSYIGPLIATFFVCLFLLLMQFLWKYIDELVGKGLEWLIIGELMLYASAQLVPMALPLAILLAAIMTFGNMGEHNELMAMKAAGMSLPRILRPLIFFNIIIGIAAFFFSNNLLPYTNMKMGALLYDIRQQKPELNIQEGVFYDGIAGISMKIGGKNHKTNILYDVMVYDHRNHPGNNNLTLADSGSILMSDNKQYLIFTLYDGATYEDVRDRSMYTPGKNTHPFRKQEFEKQEVFIELVGYDFTRSSSDFFKNNYQMLNLKQLAHTTDSLKESLLSTNVMSLERMFTNSYYQALERSKSQPSFFFDTKIAYENFPIIKKVQTYDFALELARSTQKRISSYENILKSRSENVSRHRLEWHRKFTLSAACLLLFFVGAPFGAIVRKGGLGVPILISIIFFLFYYIISMIGEKNVRIGDYTPIYGSWMPSALILIIGIFLTYRATNDSVIINISKYFRFITKHFTKALTLKEKFGKGKASTHNNEFVIHHLETLSVLLGNYAQKLEQNVSKNFLICGTLSYPHTSEYKHLRAEYYNIISEYVNSPDTKYLFIKEQLIDMPHLHIIKNKAVIILYYLFSILLIGIPFIIVGIIRIKILKKSIVKLRSHILTILSYKEKRGI